MNFRKGRDCFGFGGSGFEVYVIKIFSVEVRFFALLVFDNFFRIRRSFL